MRNRPHNVSTIMSGREVRAPDKPILHSAVKRTDRGGGKATVGAFAPPHPHDAPASGHVESNRDDITPSLFAVHTCPRPCQHKERLVTWEKISPCHPRRNEWMRESQMGNYVMFLLLVPVSFSFLFSEVFVVVG